MHYLLYTAGPERFAEYLTYKIYWTLYESQSIKLKKFLVVWRLREDQSWRRKILLKEKEEKQL